MKNISTPITDKFKLNFSANSTLPVHIEIPASYSSYCNASLLSKLQALSRGSPKYWDKNEKKTPRQTSPKTDQKLLKKYTEMK